jgi:hypothetical protein
VIGDRGGRVDDSQLPRHAEVHDQHPPLLEADEDVLAPPPDRLDAQPGDEVDEELWLRVPHDRREAQLAAHDGAAGEMRPKVRGDRLYFW